MTAPQSPGELFAEMFAQAAELRAEIRRLKSNITKVREFAERKDAELADSYDAIGRGMAAAYADMARKLTVAEYANFESPQQPVYGSPEFPFVYHEDHIDGRTLVPEYIARNMRGGNR